MSTHKHFDKICYAVLAVTLIITVLFMNGKSLGISTTQNEDADSDMFTANDFNSDWDASDAQAIVLSDNGSTVNGNGAYAFDGDIYIVNSGQYVISGELSNGSIIINSDGNDKIWLMLNGVSINCDDDAAIRVEQSDKVFLTLADSTQNTVSAGSQYNEDIISSGVDGAIYSRDDLTINGNGSLNVTAEYMHGIVCNDDLAVTGGNITVDAVKDGIHANDSIRIANANINISAGDDGITASNDDETAYLYIDSGNINISSCYEGLEAIDITIAGGTIDIYADDDGINANGRGGNSVIQITGGEITIKNDNGRDADGLDSNKDIYISGGNILVSLADDGGNCAIDYGTENGGVCEISGGTIIACGSSGMAEGFDSSSTQGFIMHTASANAGTKVVLEDADGKELVSSEIPFGFSSIVVSTPQMKVGDTCTLIIGDTEEKITIDNAAISSNFGRGAKPDEQNSGADGGNFQRQAPPDGSYRDGAQPKIPNTSDNNSPPDMPQENDNNGGQFNGGNPNQAESSSTENQTDSDDGAFQFKQNRGDFNNKQAYQTLSDSAESTLSRETVIYIAVSTGVLIIGCITAIIIKRKK